MLKGYKNQWRCAHFMTGHDPYMVKPIIRLGAYVMMGEAQAAQSPLLLPWSPSPLSNTCYWHRCHRLQISVYCDSSAAKLANYQTRMGTLLGNTRPNSLITGFVPTYFIIPFSLLACWPFVPNWSQCLVFQCSEQGVCGRDQCDMLHLWVLSDESWCHRCAYVCLYWSGHECLWWYLLDRCSTCRADGPIIKTIGQGVAPYPWLMAWFKSFIPLWLHHFTCRQQKLETSEQMTRVGPSTMDKVLPKMPEGLQGLGGLQVSVRS